MDKVSFTLNGTSGANAVDGMTMVVNGEEFDNYFEAVDHIMDKIEEFFKVKNTILKNQCNPLLSLGKIPSLPATLYARRKAIIPIIPIIKYSYIGFIGNPNGETKMSNKAPICYS